MSLQVQDSPVGSRARQVVQAGPPGPAPSEHARLWGFFLSLQPWALPRGHLAAGTRAGMGLDSPDLEPLPPLPCCLICFPIPSVCSSGSVSVVTFFVESEIQTVLDQTRFYCLSGALKVRRDPRAQICSQPRSVPGMFPGCSPPSPFLKCVSSSPHLANYY